MHVNTRSRLYSETRGIGQASSCALAAEGEEKEDLFVDVNSMYNNAAFLLQFPWIFTVVFAGSLIDEYWQPSREIVNLRHSETVEAACPDGKAIFRDKKTAEVGPVLIFQIQEG